MSNALTPGPWNGGAGWTDEGTLALTESPTPGPVGYAVDRSSPEASASKPQESEQLLDWRQLGFKSPPMATISDGRCLYRVWGGTSLEHGDPRSPGVFFSFQCPTSRLDAERLFAIAEFGNACLFVSQFDVPPGTPMLVGDVDPGDYVHPSLQGAGMQVFIQNPWAQRLVRTGQASRLENDMGGASVYTGPRARPV